MDDLPQATQLKNVSLRVHYVEEFCVAPLTCVDRTNPSTSLSIVERAERIISDFVLDLLSVLLQQVISW